MVIKCCTTLNEKQSQPSYRPRKPQQTDGIERRDRIHVLAQSLLNYSSVYNITNTSTSLHINIQPNRPIYVYITNSQPDIDSKPAPTDHHVYFFLAAKNKEGVKISSLPPSTKSSAVALSNALTRTEPLGAILKNSRVDTMAWVHIRPR